MNEETSRPEEQEAITTTIVGGRPPGCGQPVGAIPRGIEVLVKKAAADPEFRAVLLQERTRAAERIDLELGPSEAAMLDAVPAPHLERIIQSTKVKPEHRAVFLGKVAALMLMAVGMQTLSCECNPTSTRGVQPDKPINKEEKVLTFGIQPDRIEQEEPTAPPESGKPDASPKTDEKAEDESAATPPVQKTSRSNPAEPGPRKKK